MFTSGSDEKEVISEFPNYCILFTHVDAAGRDLLDPEVEGNLFGCYIRLTLKGDVFEPVQSLGETRLQPVSLALRHSYNEALSCYALLFGEFVPYVDLIKEPIAIDWGNGTRNDIRFDCHMTWENYEPQVHKRLFIDGVKNKTEDPLYVVIKR